MAISHTVAKGETIASIAQAYGFPNWRTIYDARENDTFRALRPNPHQIRIGDSIVIPDKQKKGRSITLGANHRVKLVPPQPLPAEVGITFVDKLHQNEPVGASPRSSWMGMGRQDSQQQESRGPFR